MHGWLLAECKVERAKLPRATEHHKVKVVGEVQVGLQLHEFLMSASGAREWSASRSERVARLTPYLPVFVSCTDSKFCPHSVFTRVGNLIVATIYLQLIQNRYMFRSFTVLQCSHQHCLQLVASDVEVVGYF